MRNADPPPGYCEEHGKRRYPSPKSAKERSRQDHPGKTPRVYRCDPGGNGWHVTYQDAETVTRHKDLDALTPSQWRTKKRRERRERAEARKAGGSFESQGRGDQK